MPKSTRNRTSHTIDTHHWGRIAHWTLDEAVMLSLGVDPHTADWDEIKAEASIFAKRFAKARDFAIRARQFAEFDHPVRPWDFVDWAMLSEQPFPEDLAAEVNARRGDHRHWKSTHDDLKAKHEALLQEVAQLKSELNTRPAEKPLTTKERETALKLIIGMAVEQYGYKPAENRSDVVGNIVSDLNANGLSLDPDTVRKWLKEAAELLPGDFRPTGR